MRWLAIAGLVAFHAFVSVNAVAEAPCSGVIARDSVASCSIRASLALRSEADIANVLRGRRSTFNPIVPSNPIVSASLGRRIGIGSGSGMTATNWSFGLSQEVELAGQRGLRLDAADADIAAEDERRTVLRRDVAAVAYAAYFDALAARDEAAIAARLETVALSVVKATRGMANQGLTSGVDADVAEAVSLRSIQARIAADGRVAQSRVAFTLALGGDATTPVDASGDLVPLTGVDTLARSLVNADRAEVRVFENERRAWEARASTFRRSRVPNITLSAFVQNDGFDENVFGFGIAVPIPFPQPIGHTYNGQIAESDALARHAADEAARLRLALKAGILLTLAEYDARIKQRDAVAQTQVDRADKSLQSIGTEIAAGRLAIRDAVVAQQTLVDFLLGYVAAKHAVCTASVELARAAGIPLDKGGL